ncbi:MAG: hypothetical protein MZW92_06005 [Comamonadaceae bacterium]|nr:hypothetical protein [Comamonadaceae bacterium]
MFASQAVIYILVAMGILSSYWIFLIAACYLLACYGGGFATMPAFAADNFGPGYIGKVYGFMLTAWSCAGIVGPLAFAKFKAQSLYIAAALLCIGFVLAIGFKKREQSQNSLRLIYKSSHTYFQKRKAGIFSAFRFCVHIFWSASTGFLPGRYLSGQPGLELLSEGILEFIKMIRQRECGSASGTDSCNDEDLFLDLFIADLFVEDLRAESLPVLIGLSRGLHGDIEIG